MMYVHSASLQCDLAAMQVLSFMEQLLLIYRTVVTVPCWLLFYESIGMGALLTSFMRGEPLVPLPCRSCVVSRYMSSCILTAPPCKPAARNAMYHTLLKTVA